jgi:hypothetical protein
MIKKSSFLPFPPKIFTLMVDIIILNPIGSFKVDFDSTFFFVLRPIFYLKIPLMLYWLRPSSRSYSIEEIVLMSFVLGTIVFYILAGR